jgi:hypothetical protein
MCIYKCMLNVIVLECRPIVNVVVLESRSNATHNMVYLYDACDQISDFCHNSY